MPLFVKQGAWFVRCSTCGFDFVNPRPTDEWIDERYRFYGEHVYTGEAKLQSDFARGRFTYQLALIGPVRGSLLDVGCATGAFVAAARESGFGARGIDVSAESIRYGRDALGLNLDVGDLYERAYPAETFDVITFWETLEHLTEPGKGGRLAISVPNHRGISERLLGKRYRYVGIDHVNYFSAESLRRLLGRHGFGVSRVATTNFNPIVLWQDLRREASTLEQHAVDRGRTDRIRSRRGIVSRVTRGAYTVVTRALGAVGLGDGLFVVAVQQGRQG